eukprot:m.231173 g.231173  ORF g.231173 m.231173 type:complete len:655 (-) comp12175_c0_seq1:118-2082(-)
MLVVEVLTEGPQPLLSPTDAAPRAPKRTFDVACADDALPPDSLESCADDTPPPPDSLEEPAITAEELMTCTKVLATLSQRMDTYRQPRFRDLRVHMHGFLEDARARYYQGGSPTRYLNAKDRKALRRAAASATDVELRDRTLLRAGRNQTLAALKQRYPGSKFHEHQVPDGPVLLQPPCTAAIALPTQQITELTSGEPDSVPPATPDVLPADAVMDVGPTPTPAPSAHAAAPATSPTPTATALTAATPTATAPSPVPIEVVSMESPGTLERPLGCYICKTKFTVLHFFYDQMCPPCAKLNFAKRMQTADLTGRYAIVTGGRVKIGYHTALKLLRAGAAVVVTTRFPQDSLSRYEKEADFAQWGSRLHMYGLDMRDLTAVEQFCAWYRATRPHLDILVNNACQTLRRPPAYYKTLAHAELQAPARPQITLPSASDTPTSLAEPQRSPHATLACAARTHPSLMSLAVVLPEDSLHDEAHFPPGVVDVHGQQLDLRERNSWTLRLGEIATFEAAESMAINSLAPFILCGQLRPALKASPNAVRFIVNVSSMEGKFSRFKASTHPHTNMAKAALNMMTRTAARDYFEDSIMMNAVDTGWVNDQQPAEEGHRFAQQHHFQTPLDEIDGAARVLDPVFKAALGQGADYGVFLKDYLPSEW